MSKTNVYGKEQSGILTKKKVRRPLQRLFNKILFHGADWLKVFQMYNEECQESIYISSKEKWFVKLH